MDYMVKPFRPHPNPYPTRAGHLKNQGLFLVREKGWEYQSGHAKRKKFCAEEIDASVGQ
jgi:hypothetical protein